MTAIDWTAQLADQVDWHWTHQLRPRLAGLTDDEYFWEPAPGCWNLRPRGTGSAPMAVGAGAFTVDYAQPEPTPPPVTTIAWRIGHVLVGVLGMRVAWHFGGPPLDYATYHYPGTAAEALTRLDDGYRQWIDGVRGLKAADLARPCGPSEGPFGDYPMAALVLHINRDVLAHGAEISLLRDLYLHTHRH